MSPRTEAARKVESGHMLSRAEMSLLLQGGATAATPPTAATRSPLEAQLEASRLAHASDRQVEQQLLQSKQKAESTLKRAKSDLNIASKRIQAQQAEIEILQGRNSALRIAGDLLLSGPNAPFYQALIEAQLDDVEDDVEIE